ncbi:MAG TPA: membrane-bound lytic murein transglycosylase MltF [Moraxellaceae bacterium]|nr:membrane-bound lytic murein transglycosylase MltF [Moraxellaceae bacterium]
MSSVIKALHAKPLRSRFQPRHMLRAGLLGILLFALFQLQPTTTALQQVQQRGELVVTGISGPTTFHSTSAGTRGLQYELARLFAEELGVRLVLEDAGNTQGVLDAIRRNRTDLAITGLASDDPRLTRLRTATPYMAVSEQLVQRLDRPLPASFDALGAARIGVLAGSSEAERLKALTQWRSDIQLIEFEDTDPLVLIERVDNGDLDYVALNSSEFDARRALFPNVGVALNLQDYSELAWAFLKTRDQSLYNAAQAFLERKQADGTLGRLVTFYSQGDTFDPYSLRTFQRDIAQRLPRYRLMFKHNAQKHGMDWQLLAAIAYQESHWEPSAVSPTGVQGIMMLTNDTASFMGVEDRTSPRQSISGGAAYYKMIMDNLASVPEPDRTWMALAGYNMGPAYIDRARERARRAGEDAGKWLVVSHQLRSMADEARRQGRFIPVGQALHYVQQVRRYYDALVLATNAGIDNRVAMNASPRAVQ